jgi:hypothetical protein
MMRQTMQNKTPRPATIPDLPPDHLVPDPIVAKEFGGVSLMTLYRWTMDPTLGFPPPIKIRTKNFRSRRALEDFKARIINRHVEAK